MSNIKEWIAKYQMGLYCKAKGWEVDDWDELPAIVHQKYYDEADQIISYLKSQKGEIEYPYELIEDDYDKGYKDGFNRCKQIVFNKLQ